MLNRIVVVQVSEPYSPQGKDYKKLDVTYKDKDGKIQAKTILDFVNPEVFEFVSKLKRDDLLEVTLEKDAKGYWQWVGVAATEEYKQPKEAAGGNFTSKTSNSQAWVPDEVKQANIIRQNVLDRAVQFVHFFDKGILDVSDAYVRVMGFAKLFESFVHTGEVSPIVEVPKVEAKVSKSKKAAEVE